MSNWELFVVSCALGAGNLFWLWFLIYENNQRKLEANEQQNAWWQHQDDEMVEMEQENDRHE